MVMKERTELNALTDEQLAAPRDFFGHPATAEQGIAYLMIHYVTNHAGSIRGHVGGDGRIRLADERKLCRPAEG